MKELMNKITIVHKHSKPNFYCGRGSALGNPFVMQSESQRDEVCDKYDEWFYQQVDEPDFLLNIWNQSSKLNPVTKQLKQLFIAFVEKDIKLGCFCAPKRCHCETIKIFLENKIEEVYK